MRGANTPPLHPTRLHLTGTKCNYVRRPSRQSQTAIMYAVRLVKSKPQLCMPYVLSSQAMRESFK